jgi:hypothetical protein
MQAHSRTGATLTLTTTSHGVAATAALKQRSVSVHKGTVRPIYVSLAVLRRIRSRLTITIAIHILLEQQDRIPYQRALATLAHANALRISNAMLSQYTVTVPERKDVSNIHQRSPLLTN